MSNGIASAFFLAASIVSIGGCDLAAAPSQVPDRVAPASRPPSLRYQVDAARNRVWFLTGEGVFFYDAAKPEKIAVPLPGWLWANAPYGCLPDLALGPRGEAVITSNVVPTLWSIDPETLAVGVHELALDADTDKDVGFSGLVYSPEHAAYFAVSDPQGSLWKIDRQLTTAQKIRLSAPVPKACGLALQARTPRQKLSRLAGLCALGLSAARRPGVG